MKLIRKRYWPDEEVDISKDQILYSDSHLIVTSWEPIKSRIDMKRGISYWFLDKGWKISKIYNMDDTFKHYYCDMCRFEKGDDYCKIIDLLIDVIIDKDNNYKVVDIEELVEMKEKNLLAQEEIDASIKCLSELLLKLNNNEFPFKELDMF